ncbi:hypothetical protein [Streptomyces tritici]|uniref:hypothetical protein n=1 Tax=Streptomyces tritici TaxID=2054410 RepID=UPI003AEFB000
MTDTPWDAPQPAAGTEDPSAQSAGAEAMSAQPAGADDLSARGSGPEEPSAQSAGRGRRRLLTVVLPAAVVVLALAGAAVFTGVTVSRADRSAPTDVWAETAADGTAEDPAADRARRGRADTPLSKLLLPVPDGYTLGPDEELYGNDGELGPKEAVALLKREGKGLAGKKRRDYEKRVERLGVQGFAVRSFARMPAGDLLVSVQVVRMKDKRQIRGVYELKNELASLLKFPKGPKIGGHKNSACFLMPEVEGLEAEEKKHALGGMICSAYDSDVLVSVSATGAKPFDKSEVAELVKKQLDHIKSPGEYV